MWVVFDMLPDTWRPAFRLLEDEGEGGRDFYTDHVVESDGVTLVGKVERDTEEFELGIGEVTVGLDLVDEGLGEGGFDFGLVDHISEEGKPQYLVLRCTIKNQRQ